MTTSEAASSTCPTCGESGVPLLLGLPGEAARAAAAAGELALGGCFEFDEPSNWACAAGHAWRDVTDERGWRARLLRLLERHGDEWDLWCDWCYEPLADEERTRSAALGLKREHVAACADCVDAGRFREPPAGWPGPSAAWPFRRD